MAVPFSRRAARLAGRAAVGLSDLVFVPGCLRCGKFRSRRRAGICLACWAAARPPLISAARCLDCGGPGTGCGHPEPPWSWMIAALTYEEAGRDLIRLYKFSDQGGRLPLARPLAGLLAAALRAAAISLDIDLVVPVPSHRARRRDRGFDAAGHLARHVCAATGLPRPLALIRRRGRRGPRARADDGHRSDYLLRPSAGRQVAGRTVLLLDDVCTTGATLRRCAGLLAEAGALEIRVAVLAFTPRRSFASPAGME